MNRKGKPVNDLSVVSTDELEPSVVEPANAAGDTPLRADREAAIRLAAYVKAEQRGFEPGFEEEDWLAAEREVDASTGAPASEKAG